MKKTISMPFICALTITACGVERDASSRPTPQPECARPQGYYTVTITPTFAEDTSACQFFRSEMQTVFNFNDEGDPGDLGGNCRVTYRDDDCDLRIDCSTTWSGGAMDIAFSLAPSLDGATFYGTATLSGTGAACSAAAGIVGGVRRSVPDTSTAD